MQVIKRGGEQVPFDLEKIAVAIEEAFLSLEKPGSDDQIDIQKLAVITHRN